MKYVFLIMFVLISCQQSRPTNAEYDDLQTQFKNCQKELADLQNTPGNRLLTAQEFERDGKLELAAIKYEELLSKYPESEEARVAKKSINKIENEKEQKRLNEKKKKQLGFKALKEQTSINQGDLKLTFSKIQLTKRWYFDRYGDRYFYRDSERGSKHLTSTLNIYSKSNNPLLPPIYVYKLEGEQLIYMSTVSYEFYRWKDYAAYLGNNADYGNDFAHTSEIRFAIGVELSNKETESNPIFVMVKKDNCVLRVNNSLKNPPISYTSLNCNYDKALDIDKAESNYFTIKIFNKSKI